MTGDRGTLVIGGGPSGSMFALQLARKGRPVTLLEKSREPHNKVCGEFLSCESLLYLSRIGLAVEQLGGVPIEAVRLITAQFERQCTLPFRAWSLTRRQLDETLLRCAASQGTHVVRGAHVASLEREGSMWSASLRDGQRFTSREAVLATGKLDLSGWPRPVGKQPDLVAFKMYYRLTADQHSELGNAVEVILFPGGYAGLQPVEHGLVNLCFLIASERLRRVGSGWSAVLPYLLEHSPHLRKRLQGAIATLEKPLTASNIPYGHLQSGSPDGLWRIGDQAAVIPSFAGDGTAIALHSGMLAAASMLRGRSATACQQQLHRQLRLRLWLATQLSRMLVGMPQAALAAYAIPGVLSTLASLTRIPDHALASTSY